MKTPHTAVAIQWVGYLWTAPRIFPKENKVLLGAGLPLFPRAIPASASLCAPRTCGFDDDTHGKVTGLVVSPLLVQHTQPSQRMSPDPGRKRFNPQGRSNSKLGSCGTATPETTSWLSLCHMHSGRQCRRRMTWGKEEITPTSGREKLSLS